MLPRFSMAIGCVRSNWEHLYPEHLTIAASAATLPRRRNLQRSTGSLEEENSIPRMRLTAVTYDHRALWGRERCRKALMSGTERANACTLRGLPTESFQKRSRNVKELVVAGVNRVLEMLVTAGPRKACSMPCLQTSICADHQYALMV